MSRKRMTRKRFSAMTARTGASAPSPVRHERGALPQVQSVTYTDGSYTHGLAGAEGLEPPTLGFGDRCSTN